MRRNGQSLPVHVEAGRSGRAPDDARRHDPLYDALFGPVQADRARLPRSDRHDFRHPFCAGAYTGNRPDAKPENYGSKAIEFEAFKAHVASQIAEHNSRPGRKAAACRGRSFEETFRDSLAKPDTVVRWASESQRSLWLMAATHIKARSGNGEIHFMGNRYWHPALTGHAGSQVTVRYDPDDLKAGVKVYD